MVFTFIFSSLCVPPSFVRSVNVPPFVPVSSSFVCSIGRSKAFLLLQFLFVCLFRLRLFVILTIPKQCLCCNFSSFVYSIVVCSFC